MCNCFITMILQTLKKGNNYQNNYPHFSEYYLHFLIRDFQVFVPQITFLPIILEGFKGSLCLMRKPFTYHMTFLFFIDSHVPLWLSVLLGSLIATKLGKGALLIPRPKVESMKGQPERLNLGKKHIDVLRTSLGQVRETDLFFEEKVFETSQELTKPHIDRLLMDKLLKFSVLGQLQSQTPLMFNLEAPAHTWQIQGFNFLEIRLYNL